MKKIVLAILILALCYQSANAESYTGNKNNFSIVLNDDWTIIETPDMSTDVMFGCIAKSCDDSSNLAFGTFFNYQLKDGKQSEFLMHANGSVITTNIRNNPFVKNLKILREGRTKLGNTNAYEVLMSYEYTDGRKRIRHTFMTFNAGYVYNISFHSTPTNYEKDFQLAKPVLSTFRFVK